MHWARCHKPLHVQVTFGGLQFYLSLLGSAAPPLKCRAQARSAATGNFRGLSAFPTKEGRASGHALAKNMEATLCLMPNTTQPHVVVTFFTPHLRVEQSHANTYTQNYTTQNYRGKRGPTTLEGAP